MMNLPNFVYTTRKLPYLSIGVKIFKICAVEKSNMAALDI